MFDATWKAIRPSRSSDPSKEGMKISLPPPPLPSEVFDSADWYWYEGKRVRRAPRGVVDADYDVGSHLNLGTETPLSGSISPYPFPPSRGSVTAEHRSHNEGGSNMSMPSSKLGPSARRNSLTSKKREADRDCGICLENAVKPCRARCCGKMFCSDHLNDWLGTSEHCPNCNAPLTLGGDNTIMLSSPLNSERSSETPKRATPRRGSQTPSASQSAPRITTSSSSRGGALFHIATPATDDSLSTGVPTPPPPYHLTGEDIELLANELNLGSLLSTSINGTDTPTVWTPTAFQKSKIPGSKRPGMYDAVFSSEKETLTTASRLATLVAFVLLLYVVLG
ncbi:hypothetical protein BKA70DRAFT_58802 [Coprinopsis sp. MPI-PUGE-AT-0042]|nr:hypothetical protein BKA70DRAFT_58802 [Coprinopsis sp. MPI-PUGE-AT-0042]